MELYREACGLALLNALSTRTLLSITLVAAHTNAEISQQASASQLGLCCTLQCRFSLALISMLSAPVLLSSVLLMPASSLQLMTTPPQPLCPFPVLPSRALQPPLSMVAMSTPLLLSTHDGAAATIPPLRWNYEGTNLSLPLLHPLPLRHCCYWTIVLDPPQIQMLILPPPAVIFTLTSNQTYSPPSAAILTSTFTLTPTSPPTLTPTTTNSSSQTPTLSPTTYYQLIFSYSCITTDLTSTCITICTVIAYTCITTFNDLSITLK